MVYTITINKDLKTVCCSCIGFSVHGRCKHIAIYKNTIQHFLYGCDYISHVVENFRNCRDLLQQLLEVNPLLMYSYNDMVAEVHKHRLYSTETITRTYRRLREEGLITEPLDLEMRRKETERVFKDINQWSPEIVRYGQSKLFDMD